MEENAKAWALSLNGQTIGGRYRLGRPIGIGGMGAVFLGEHQAVGRTVAVKILFPELVQNSETVRRFQREARAAAAIARRGVVDILDFDVDSQLGPYLVMEHLKGESLLSRIKTTGRLDPTTAFSIAAQISETLAAVHAREIIHRDLKPANVFLTVNEDGEEEARLLDFGISRVAPAPGKAPLTVPGTVLGTPRYMAPEQAACDPGVDHRVDIYATGLILFHAISGVKPFAEIARGALLIAVIRDGPTPLRHLRPGLPNEVYAVVEQAMARDRNQRFQSAMALARSIEQVISLLPPSRPRPRLTTDDDEGPTAVETLPDSTIPAAQPLAAPPTTKSAQAMHFEPEASHQTADVAPPQDPGATISEIPSRRLPVTHKAAHSDIDRSAPPTDGPLQPPDTVDVVKRDGAPPTVLGNSGPWVEYVKQPSAESEIEDVASGELLAGQNLRESGPYLPYSSTPSYASIELDTRESSPPERVPSGKQRSVPPKTLVEDGSHAAASKVAPRPATSSRTSAVTPPISSSATPRRRGRWLLFLIVGVVALAVGAGGLILGLHLWKTFQDLSQ